MGPLDSSLIKIAIVINKGDKNSKARLAKSISNDLFAKGIL
jgi:hypothetical protein